VRDEPEELPTAALDWITGVTIALMQRVFGQRGMEMDTSWPAADLQQSRVTWYEVTHAALDK